MSETIRVTGFAGLKHVELELNEFNLLIGPQATGKSVLAKLLFYMKGVIGQVFSAAENNQSKRELDLILLKRFEELFPQQSWGKDAFEIHYSLNGLKISISRVASKKSALTISYSRFFHTELNRLKRFFISAQEKHQDDEDFDRYEVIFRMRETLSDAARKEFGPTASFTQLFIPAGRSFFANLQSSIFSFLSGNNAIDPFLKEFGSFYENIKRAVQFPRRRTEENKAFLEESEKLIQEILCGKYITEKGRDYLDVIDGRRINLGNCSSGQQETLPLALMLKRLPFLRGRFGGSSVYIEEPEAHLFPTAQRLILELIALTFNAAQSRLQVVITTHSPYVLTALNNLIQAGALYDELGQRQSIRLSHLVPRTRAITLKSISAYSLTRHGCESIIDIENELLKTDLIDQVSTELAVQFDELLSLE
jgi:hypothetical protein